MKFSASISLTSGTLRDSIFGVLNAGTKFNLESQDAFCQVSPVFVSRFKGIFGMRRHKGQHDMTYQKSAFKNKEQKKE
jgi:hypothetical protein